jgi:hypothetical protein
LVTASVVDRTLIWHKECCKREKIFRIIYRVVEPINTAATIDTVAASERNIARVLLAGKKRMSVRCQWRQGL